MVWYGGSILGYVLMQKYHQGLDIKSSRDMFLFTASETLFMVSMAMCYFFSYQTYSVEHPYKNPKNQNDVILAVTVSEVIMAKLGVNVESMFTPVTSRLEQMFGGKFFSNSDEK